MNKIKALAMFLNGREFDPELHEFLILTNEEANELVLETIKTNPRSLEWTPLEELMRIPRGFILSPITGEEHIIEVNGIKYFIYNTKGEYNG